MISIILYALNISASYAINDNDEDNTIDKSITVPLCSNPALAINDLDLKNLMKNVDCKC